MKKNLQRQQTKEPSQLEVRAGIIAIERENAGDQLLYLKNTFECGSTYRTDMIFTH